MGVFRHERLDEGVKAYLNRDLTVHPDRSVAAPVKYDRYILPDRIYQHIEKRFKELML